jgi:TatD DNase family protein
MQLIDSHCHLDLQPLRPHAHKLITEAAAVGVGHFVVPGVHPDGWDGMAELAATQPNVRVAYGVHPMHADLVDTQVLLRLQKIVGQAVAIGEIGLDPAYAVSVDCQEVAFRQQLRIAVACGVPVLIHCRTAFQRLLTVLREEGAERVGGIMHAYSGSPEMARDFIRLGFAIAVSGTVTWSNAVKPLRVAAEVPLEHLVLETDAPDMTPQKYRGRFNRPAWLVETAQKVAELRGITLAEVAQATTANASRVLRLG